MPIEYRINLRLDPKAYDELDKYAKRMFISKAEALRFAVGKLINEEKRGMMPAGKASTTERTRKADGVQNVK